MARINFYRKNKFKPPIPFSISLCNLGERKVRELAANTIRLNCGLHSWSNCCYKNDKKCMSEAPKQRVLFDHAGVEIVSDEFDLAENNLPQWISSQNLILDNERWKSMGAGVTGGFVSIWFSEGEDQRSTAECNAYFDEKWKVLSSQLNETERGENNNNLFQLTNENQLNSKYNQSGKNGQFCSINNLILMIGLLYIFELN